MVIGVVLLVWNPERKSIAYRQAFKRMESLVNYLAIHSDDNNSVKIAEICDEIEIILDDTF